MKSGGKSDLLTSVGIVTVAGSKPGANTTDIVDPSTDDGSGTTTCDGSGGATTELPIDGLVKVVVDDGVPSLLRAA